MNNINKISTLKKVFLVSALLSVAGFANAAKGRVVNNVSLGGADICEALNLPTGCDANFSLVAKKFADGSVKGQWQDTGDGGGIGLHADIDCLNVVGNGAVIGGIISHGTLANGTDVSGQRIVTAVVDNGTSSNQPSDQISTGFIGNFDCNNLVPSQFPLYILTHGQVKVK